MEGNSVVDGTALTKWCRSTACVRQPHDVFTSCASPRKRVIGHTNFETHKLCVCVFILFISQCWAHTARWLLSDDGCPRDSSEGFTV